MILDNDSCHLYDNGYQIHNPYFKTMPSIETGYNRYEKPEEGDTMDKGLYYDYM